MIPETGRTCAKLLRNILCPDSMHTKRQQPRQCCWEKSRNGVLSLIIWTSAFWNCIGGANFSGTLDTRAHSIGKLSDSLFRSEWRNPPSHFPRVWLDINEPLTVDSQDSALWDVHFAKWTARSLFFSPVLILIFFVFPTRNSHLSVAISLFWGLFLTWLGIKWIRWKVGQIISETYSNSRCLPPS